VATTERDGSGGVRQEPLGANEGPPGAGLLKGLGVTLKHMLRPSVTQTYPHVHPDLPARTRGVIALKQENCTVCYKCSRACPDWCIYIDAHKETHEPAGGGKGRSVKVLDRFAIDYSLCMYCGICVEVCPFDALFWSPEFEYAEYDILELLHEKERLEEWTYTVLPPPPIELGAEPEPEPIAPQQAPAAAPAAPPAAPPAVPAAPAPAASAASAEVAARPPRAPRIEVEPDQETYARVLAEQLAKGTDRRIAEGRAKSAALKAARERASGSDA
jgi:formate hydrogenlyase subunit 6/NADH:ubiquinone oxidoreductase subunit I